MSAKNFILFSHNPNYRRERKKLGKQERKKGKKKYGQHKNQARQSPMLFPQILSKFQEKRKQNKIHLFQEECVVLTMYNKNMGLCVITFQGVINGKVTEVVKLQS